MRLHRRLGWAACLALIGFGCKKTATTEPNPTPTIQVSLSPSSIAIDQGSNGQVVATVTGAGGFSAAAVITVEGVPSGVTGSVSGVSTTGGTTTATVTIDVAVTTAPGSYPITVRASGAGVAAVTASLALTVSPRPAAVVSVDPGSATVLQGGTATVNVGLARTNFTGPVTLTLEGAPTGVTGTFAPQPATAQSSVLTLQVGATAALGPSTLTIRAAGQGIAASTTTFVLTVTQPVSIALSATPVTATVGASGASRVTISRTNFPGPVALTAEGLPNGVTAGFNPASTSGPTSVLTLTVAGTVTPGNHTITLRGTGAGVADATTTVTLTVVAQQGGFTLTVVPGSIGVSRGGGSAAFVAINRTGGFTGPVALTVTGAPVGLTATIPASASGSTASLQLVAAVGINLGTYPLVVTGTAPGLPDRTAPLEVVVNVANVDLSFAGCGTGTPIWLAVQDGVGEQWVEHLVVDGRYKTKLLKGKGGIAFVTAGFGNNHSLLVLYDDTEALWGARGDVLCGNPIQPSRTATASTTNLTAFQAAFVAFGGGQRVFSSALPGGTISGIQAGMHDLIAHVQQSTGGFSASDRLIIRRDLNPADGGSLGAPLNFTSLEAMAPISATISVTGLEAGEQLNSGGTQYITGASCQTAPLWSQALVGGGSSFTAYGVPLILQRPTDFHQINVTAIVPATTFRQVSEFSGPLGNRAIALPANLPVPTITSLTAPYARLQFDFVTSSEAANVVTANYGFSTGSPVFLTATQGWLSGTAVSLVTPDFTQSADWNDAWAPAVGTSPLAWTITGSGSAGCAVGRTVGLSRNGNF